MDVLDSKRYIAFTKDGYVSNYFIHNHEYVSFQYTDNVNNAILIPESKKHELSKLSDISDLGFEEVIISRKEDNNILENRVIYLQKICSDLTEKLNKYRWHNLEENPKDLPLNTNPVLLKHTNGKYSVGIPIFDLVSVYFVDNDSNLFIKQNILEWKEIENNESSSDT